MIKTDTAAGADAFGFPAVASALTFRSHACTPGQLPTHPIAAPHWPRSRLFTARLNLGAISSNGFGKSGFRGIMGYGAASRIHTAKVLRLSEDLPVVIDIIDTEENIEKLMPYLDEVVTEGLVTMEKAQIIKYRHGKDRPT